MVGHEHFVEVGVQENMAEFMGANPTLLHLIQGVIDVDDMATLDVLMKASNPA